jgi:hypothetical protein
MTLFTAIGRVYTRFDDIKWLPSEEEMDNLRSHLAMLERDESVNNLCKAGIQAKVRSLLAMQSSFDVEVDLDLINCDATQLSEDGKKKLLTLMKTLRTELRPIQNLIDKDLMTLEGPNGYWNRLETPNDHRDAIKGKLLPNYETVFSLHREVSRCEELFDYFESCARNCEKKLEKVATMLRMTKKTAESSSLWDPLEYNDKTLKIFKKELSDLQKFYTDNKKILDAFEKRQSLRTELDLMIQKNADKQKLSTNNGAKNLNDETVRKDLEKTLLKTESELHRATEVFKKLHKKPFTIFNVPIQVDAKAEAKLYRMKVQPTEPRLKKPLANATNI